MAGKLEAGAWTGFTSGNARLGARQFAPLRCSHLTRVCCPSRTITTASPPSLPPPSPILARRTQQQNRSERALLKPVREVCRSDVGKPSESVSDPFAAGWIGERAIALAPTQRSSFRPRRNTAILLANQSPTSPPFNHVQTAENQASRT